jgi:hypothetical protein
MYLIASRTRQMTVLATFLFKIGLIFGFQTGLTNTGQKKATSRWLLIGVYLTKVKLTHHSNRITLAAFVRVQGQGAVLDVAFFVKSDGTGHAFVAIGFSEDWQVFCWL